MPVLAVEFGAATGRGEIQENQVTSRGLGYYSEKEQGKILVDCYERHYGCRTFRRLCLLLAG